MTETPLDLLERAIANGAAELILSCSTPHGALAQAEEIMASDPTAARDFGNAQALAIYVRTMAMPQRRAALRAVERPDDPPAIPSCPAAELHAMQAEARRNPSPAPPAEARTSPAPAPAPAREPEQVAPPMKLAMPREAGATSARLSLAAASSSLGLPSLDALPLTVALVAALRDCGLDPRAEGHAVTLDAGAVERVAADPAAVEGLLLRLTRAAPRLNHVGGGGTIAFR